ncbi:hypothetical protein X275_00640 [Marinitoga sp. 1197]|uniref:DUF7033 domain-containing protein n=1 Tax=Marinitoga sp. 1197 TaxID=1428449 RepID=UPI000640FE7E|nr:hypothetical protein [Marinitoga sp. 1197]KLO24338.1 hypothetical protein X275_00640 [Marinitoga sp. 1197]
MHVNLNENNIKDYITNYFNIQFKDKIKIEIDKGFYIINNKIKYPIYKFWEKRDNELLKDFNGKTFNNDYIGTMFFFLSGYWEYIHNDKKDKYGRFPYKESFQYKKEITEEPIVDILLEEIRKNLKLEYKAKNPQIFITHDIDHLYLLKGKNFYRGILGDIIKRKDSTIVFDKIKRKSKNKDPYDINNLIEIHKKYGTKGTFFFMPDIQPKKTDGGYNLNKNKKYLVNIKKQIKEIDGDIGIHYDVRYLDENRMNNDIKKIEEIFNDKIISGRAHYLIFDITKTYEILEKSGIKLDTTGGYAEHIGFRFGTSKPFKPYNFNKNKEYNLIEVPLIIMDGTLQSNKYMNISPEKGFEKIKNIIEKIKKYNGIFTFLWHNSSFYTSQWKNWEWVYKETLKYVINRGYNYINAKDIFRKLEWN